MRVLHVITGLHAGGAEQQLAALLEHTRHDADVVTMYAPGMIARRLRAGGVTVHDLDRPHQLDPRAVTDLIRLIRRGRYDVVHTHLYRACLYGRTAARIAGVDVIVATEHSLGDTQIEGRPTTAPVRALYLASERLGDHTIAVSPAARRRLVAWGVPDRRISVIPNGVDVARYGFDPAARRRERTALGIADGDVVIGTVGRLHPIKRHDLLITAAADLVRGGDAHLVIAGRGDLEDDLRAQVARLGLTGRVHLVGERGDVPALLSAFDVYAAPSAEETFGLSVIEALCAGLPAVVGACPAIDDLTLPGVRRCDDADSLRAALTAFHQRIRRDGPASRGPAAEVVARMDIVRVADNVDNLYQDVGIRRAGGKAHATA
ncbi:MAG TPA: glycosyltransferase [Euzebyales bacterium]|nr:glycosyltransferase [Euzebyales bacterium]